VISLFSLARNSDSPHQLIDWHLRCLFQVHRFISLSAVFNRLGVWRGGRHLRGVLATQVFARGALGTEVVCANGDVSKSWRPLSVGKKARPMGARLPKSKANPLLNPLPQPLAPTPCSLLTAGLGGGGGGQRGVCSRLQFLGQMVMWRKSRRPRSVGKKTRPMGARLAQARKSKANPLLNPLLRSTPCSTPCSNPLLAAGLRCACGSGLLGK
jgi:hypothetical protein